MPQPNATSPFEIAYALAETAILTEFTDITQKVVEPDEIHESLGFDGFVHIGVAPTRDTPQTNAMIVQETWFTIQWFGPYDKAVNPMQSVDARPITVMAERLRRAIKTVSVPRDDQVWFLNWAGAEYPRDPTGNKTRFVATLRAVGNNAALIETTA